MTDQNFNCLTDTDYYPYGGIAYSGDCPGDSNHYKFNAKEQDEESGNYYYGGTRPANPCGLSRLGGHTAEDQRARSGLGGGAGSLPAVGQQVIELVVGMGADTREQVAKVGERFDV